MKRRPRRNTAVQSLLVERYGYPAWFHQPPPSHDGDHRWEPCQGCGNRARSDKPCPWCIARKQRARRSRTAA